MQNVAVAGQASGSTIPELGHLKSAAERIAIVTMNLEAFLYRFNGPGLQDGSAACPPQPPESYRNDINQLFEQVSRLETAATALSAIG